MRYLYLSGIALLLSVSAAAAQTSVACTYMLMRVYHAELDSCHVALPKDREQRYSRLRIGMEKFIRQNAKNDPEKILGGIETSNIPRALKGLKSCQSEDFKLARQAMDQMTSPESENAIKSMLLTPRDPMVGDCSS